MVFVITESKEDLAALVVTPGVAVIFGHVGCPAAVRLAVKRDGVVWHKVATFLPAQRATKL